METLSFSPLLPSISTSPILPNTQPPSYIISNSIIKKPISHSNSCKIISTTTPPKRHHQYSLHELIFKPLHEAIANLSNNLPLPQGLDPKCILSGNFSPVDELPPTPCHVVDGSLPPSLNGAYILNTSNPRHPPRGPYHLADGDGMLHSVKISNGRAIYCNRYIRTHKYALEADLGYPVIPNFVATLVGGQSHGLPVLTSLALYGARMAVGQVRPEVTGIGTANTNLALFNGCLLALVESDLPYFVRITPDGDVITLGRDDDFYGGARPGGIANVTAHPKVDRETGELFAFRISSCRPFLTLFRVGPDGRSRGEVEIGSMRSVSLMHDFALTKRFAILPDTQMVADPANVLKKKPMVGFKPEKVPRLGVIPRYAEDERGMFWVDVPGLNMVHVVNAWEENDGRRIVVMAANPVPFEHIFESMHFVNISLERVVIDAKTRRVVEMRPVSGRSLEFGMVNPRYEGKMNRYIYAAEMETLPKVAGVVKVDLSLISDGKDDCVVASRLFGEGCYGSQPIFVTREAENREGDEDDGYLLSYVHNEKTCESHLSVMDAKSRSLEIVAAVKLPRRVPYGFHSIFVKESDLNKV